MAEDTRTLLVRDGIVPAGPFSSEIRSSWQRCYDTGLDPFGSPSHVQVNDADLNKRREDNDVVRRLAKMEMENLHRQIAGSKFVIVFADKDGVVLDRIVDGPVHSNNHQWTLPGSVWQEEVNGTNALGLVAVTGRPAIVHGSEHYFRTYGVLTCAAAPIFGRNGSLVGIIDATSDCRSRQRHTLALVGMSCLTIENGLFRDRHKGTLIFELHNRREFLGTLQSAMLAFDEEGFIVESNRQARLFLPDMPRERVHFDQIFRTPFKRFLNRLPGARSVNLVDMEGSSFAVRAFNYHPRKRPDTPVPPHPFIRDSREIQMVSEDPSIRSAMHMVRRAVELSVPILIRGETGTGKEVMARYAHAVSSRKGEFVAVNCAALPANLIESELFGYQDGAFTGATRGGAKGLVRQANRGTLFLDEIGTMPAAVQAKLLRFLDRMEIRPIGNATEIPLDIQLISATNTVSRAKEGTDELRPDLLYRINTTEVCLPPLRQRRDFQAILDAIIETFQHPLELEPGALRLLEAHHWPGNIRELKGILTRLLIMCESGKAGADDVEKVLGVSSAGPGEEQSKNLADQELEIVRSSYERNSGNISAIARELGISRNTVYKKLKDARKLRPKP
jgi:transcriptional regulator of acetoin/glycerol metabolism